MSVRHSALSASGAGTAAIATVCCPGGDCRSAETTRTAMIAPAATTIAAISNARGGPSRVWAAAAQTLRAHSVGDRAGQGAGDAGDLLHAGNDVGLQVGDVVGADAHDHVVRAGDVLRRQDAREGGELLGDDLGTAHLGLDQHESLDHPFPFVSMHRILAGGTKRTAGPACVQATKEAAWQPTSRLRVWPGWGSSP